MTLRTRLSTKGYDQFPNEGARHDPKSKARFLAKVGPEQMQLLRERNADPVWCSEQYERARKQYAFFARFPE